MIVPARHIGCLIRLTWPRFTRHCLYFIFLSRVYARKRAAWIRRLTLENYWATFTFICHRIMHQYIPCPSDNGCVAIFDSLRSTEKVCVRVSSRTLQCDRSGLRHRHRQAAPAEDRALIEYIHILAYHLTYESISRCIFPAFCGNSYFIYVCYKCAGIHRLASVRWHRIGSLGQSLVRFSLTRSASRN